MADPSADDDDAFSRDWRSSRLSCCCADTTCPAAVLSPASRWPLHSFSSTWPAERSGWRRGCASCQCAGWASACCSPSVLGPAAWLFDRPFLTSSFSYVEIPLIGAVPLASAFLFDLGVFALVVGATVLMLIAIAHQSVRSHRAPSGRVLGRACGTSKGRGADDGDHHLLSASACSPARASG